MLFLSKLEHLKYVSTHVVSGVSVIDIITYRVFVESPGLWLVFFFNYYKKDITRTHYYARTPVVHTRECAFLTRLDRSMPVSSQNSEFLAKIICF